MGRFDGGVSIVSCQAVFHQLSIDSMISCKNINTYRSSKEGGKRNKEKRGKKKGRLRWDSKLRPQVSRRRKVRVEREMW